MKHTLVKTADEWQQAINRLREMPAVSVDVETTGLSPFHDAHIVGVSVGVPGAAWYCPVRHEAPGCKPEENIRGGLVVLAALLADPNVRKVFHNAAFDVAFLEFECACDVENVDDTLTLASVCDERRLSPLYKTHNTEGSHGSLSLDTLGRELLGWGKGRAEDELEAWCKEHGPGLLGITDPHKASGFRRARGTWKTAIRFAPLSLVAAYACMDADLPIRIMSELGTPRIYEEVERRLLPHVFKMNTAPKHLDLDYLAVLEERSQAWEDAACALIEETSPGLNPRSPMQVANALFSREGLYLPVQGFSKKSGLPKTDRESLLKIERLHGLPFYILQSRDAHKLRSTYAKALRTASTDEGCIYPLFKNWSTQTGRFSSSNPNFQNIPRGDVVRRAVMAPEGHALVFIDYGQIEPRLMAHFSGSRAMIGSFVSGEDCYGAMARLIFPECSATPVNEIKAKFPMQRQVSKVAVLATFYGAGARKLRSILLTQAGVHYTESRCRNLLWRIRNAFPEVISCVRQLTQKAKETGIVENPYGRMRHVGWREGGMSLKEVFNTTIQGTAADIMKMAIIRCGNLLRGTSTRMVMTVHDEIVFAVPYEELSVVPELVSAMQEDWPFRVPMLAEPSWGVSWGAKKEFDFAPGWEGKVVESCEAALSVL